jgi:hypothetical protein
MRALEISLLVFVLTIGGTLGGMLVRAKLPDRHLSDASQSVVKLGIGVVSTMAALVLGLLIASAATSYNVKRGQINQITAEFIFLDRALAEYGTEADPIRSGLRQAIAPLVARIWRDDNADEKQKAPFAPDVGAEALFRQIKLLSAKSDFERFAQDQALNAATQLAQTRLLLFAQSSSEVPVPFLAILIFWLVFIFFSFGLPAPPNLTIFTILLICAFSASAAIFLILEMSDPFNGLMMIPSAPLQNALTPLGM